MTQMLHVPQRNCFTQLRYIFALGIFLNHVANLMGQPAMLCHSGVFVQGFFVLSGLLTFNSYMQNPDPKQFFLRRALRILPAYVAAVLFCFILGCSLTTLPIAEFLTHGETRRYLISNLLFLNFLQPTMPGVFGTLATPVVNGALWTMKIEVLFYLTVPPVHWLMRRLGARPVLITVIALSIVYAGIMDHLLMTTGRPLFHTLRHQLPTFLAFFYAPVLLGMQVSRLRNIPPQLLVFIISAIVTFACYHADMTDTSTVLSLGTIRLLQALSLLLTPFAFTLLLISTSSLLTPLIPNPRWLDISYEFYLLHFPVLQTIILILTTSGIGLIHEAASVSPAELNTSDLHFSSFGILLLAVTALPVTFLLALLLHRAIARIFPPHKHRPSSPQ